MACGKVVLIRVASSSLPGAKKGTRSLSRGEGLRLRMVLMVLIGVEREGRALGQTLYIPSPRLTTHMVNKVTGVLGKILSPQRDREKCWLPLSWTFIPADRSPVLKKMESQPCRLPCAKHLPNALAAMFKHSMLCCCMEEPGAQRK